MVGRNFKFPTPASCKLRDGSVLCNAEQVLALYNQTTGKNQQRITEPVKKWFISQVPNNGWAGGHFIPDVQSGHGAGCVLFVPPSEVNVSIKVTKNMLILRADES